MKRKTTKDILAESFRELAQNRPADKITIQEIADNCDYSPATFYRHFKDKYDLIAWDYVHQTNEIISKMGDGGYDWKQTLTDVIIYYRENKDYICNLLCNTSGYHAFIRYMSEANVEHLTKCILKMSGRKELDEDVKVQIIVYCYGTVQTVCRWLLGEIKYDGDRLADHFTQALPMQLRDVLGVK